MNDALMFVLIIVGTLVAMCAVFGVLLLIEWFVTVRKRL